MASTKREQLLGTAERLFYEEGFHATGIDRIVAAAGVVRMTLYNHFPSKDSLVAAVLERRHDRFLARLDAATAGAEPGAATRALVDAHGAWLASDGQRGCFLMKTMSEYAEHSRAIYAQALAAKRDLLERIEAALAQDGFDESSGLARRVFLVLEGSNAAALALGADAAASEARDSVETLLTASRMEAS